MNKKIDKLYAQAVEVVKDSMNTSPSYLQKRFSIGYIKASELIWRMEKEGIIKNIKRKRTVIKRKK